jgi:hypothetical protein
VKRPKTPRFGPPKSAQTLLQLCLMAAQIEQSNRPLVIIVSRAHLIGGSIAHGILGSLAGLLLFYFKAEQHGLKLLGLSAGLGVFVAIISFTRAGFKKQQVVIVDESGVQIENEKERVVLRWGELDGVSHWVHGGDYWEFRSRNRSQPVVLKGLYFEKVQCKQLSEYVSRYKGLTEEQPNMERLLKDALVY